MRSWVLSFGVGVFAGCFMPVLPPIYTSALFCLPLLFTTRFPGLRLAAAFAAGIAWIIFNANLQAREALPDALEQKELVVQGVIDGLPQEQGVSTRFTLSATFLCHTNGNECALAAPSVRRSLLLSDFSGRKYRPGEQWQLKVRLKRPHGFANPGSFDYEAWLFSSGIDATGYVREGEENRLLDSRTSPGPIPGFDLLRYQFRDSLGNLPLSHSGLVLALTIGDRYLLSDRDWDLMTKSGTNHLMVISGLHLSLVAWFVFRFSESVFRRSPPLCRTLPAGKLASLFSLLAVFCYAGFAGFSLPVQRALVMVCCVFAGLLLDRQTHAVNHLCLALFLVLLIDPFAPLDTGFWLSFGAVTMLLLSVGHIDETGAQTWLDKSLALIHSQCFLFVGLAPIMLFFFYQVSLLAPLVNLIAIPFIGLLVVPLCLLTVMTSVFLPAALPRVASMPDFLLSVYTHCLTEIVSLGGEPTVTVPSLPVWGTLIQIVLIVSLLSSHRPRLRGLIILVLLLPYLFRVSGRAQGEFRLDILDTGQGLAAVVSTQNHVLLYDTGPGYSPRFNAGSGVVVPYLKKANLGRPDRIILSHADNDHAGGLVSLLSFYPNIPVIAGEAPKTGIQWRNCHREKAWNWDGVNIEFLSNGSISQNSHQEGNNASCVLRISNGRFTALLPGDIEKGRELELVKHYRHGLRSDILIVPHHGSQTSSTSPFIRAVNPSHAVVTAGYLNRFNHPHPEVMARYRRFNINLINTSDAGMVSFVVPQAGELQGPLLYRQSTPRFWYPQTSKRD